MVHFKDVVGGNCPMTCDATQTHHRGTDQNAAGPAEDTRASGSGLRLKYVDPADITDDQLALWRSFQRSDPLLESPYLSLEFARIVASIRKGVTVAVLEVDGEVVGFLPFLRRGRIGHPLAGNLDDCQAIIAAPGREWDPPTLVRAAGLSVYDFTYLRAAQRPFVPFHRRSAPSHVIDLAEGYDAYVRERAAAGHHVLNKRTREKARSLERRGPLRFKMHDPDPRSLRRLLDWKSQQYRRNRLQDRFARRWTVELLERIHATRTDTFSGVLSTLSVGDRLIAAQMGMRSTSVLHYWFPAYDTEFSKFSPGVILLNELCRASAAAGIRAIELGPGDEPYKFGFANAAIPTASGFVGSFSLPYLHRRMRYSIEDMAMRLPIGRFRLWPEKLFRRIDIFIGLKA